MTASIENANDTTPHRPADEPAAGRVVLALARVEGARLVHHPATIAGLLASTLVATSLLWGVLPVLPREAATLSLAASPLAAGVLLAAHLAASRLNRDDTAPLAAIAPTSSTLRTAAIIVALLWPAGLALMWVAAALAIRLMAGGGGGAPHVADVLATPGLVLLAGAAGAALGRWLPSPFVPGFAVAVVAIAGVPLSTRTSTDVRLLPWADWFPRYGVVETWPRAPWLHLAYVLLLAATLVALALLADRRGLSVGAVSVAGGIATVLAAAQLVTVWADPDAVADYQRQQDPGHVYVCDGEAPVEVCVPPAYQHVVPRLRAPALAARDQLPAQARPERLRVSVVDDDPSATLVGSVPPRVRSEGVLATDHNHDFHHEPGHITASAHQRLGANGDAQYLDIVLEVLLPAVGQTGTGTDGATDATLSTLTAVDDECVPQTPAREVVAFALAADTDPAARRALVRELDERPYGWGTDGQQVWWDDWFTLAGISPVGSVGGPDTDGSRAGATLGLQLAQNIDTQDLHADWDRWLDPDTTADELAAAFDLQRLPTPRDLANDAGLTWDADLARMVHPACA